jgi:hypothetical protein
MIATQLNPPWLEPTQYIDFLNAGFPGQWDRASFDFYMARGFLDRRTDIGVRAAGGRILAGVSYCYRQITVGQNTAGRDGPIDVCIMSAGTTLPSERGRGHYRELLQTGIDLCREKSCAAILGFVTRENGSARGLQRLGAYSIPSFYVVSAQRKIKGRRALRLASRRIDPADVAFRPTDFAVRAHVRFHYARHRDWLQQFVHRANPVRAVRMAHDATALVETVGSTDRLQWLGCPAPRVAACIAQLAAASHAANRKFFMYTLDPLLARSAARLGLSIRAGLLMVLPVDHTRADWRQLAGAKWGLQSGDRM